MRCFKSNVILLLALCLSTTMCQNQLVENENPRGIYKMKSLVDKNGKEIESPFDQYKLCTDSISLTLCIDDVNFWISKEASILNYTGEEPDKKQADAIRIYDSNAEHFTLKWWSKFPNHLYFPNDGWCTEFYVANSYSEKGKILFDALTQPAPAANPKHPLYGNWHRIDLADELNEVKEEWEARCKQEKTDEIFSGLDIIVINETHFIYSGGDIFNAKSDGKTFFCLQGDKSNSWSKMPVTWLSDNYVVVTKQYGNFADYELWKRITDDVPPISHIAALFVNRK